MKLKIETIVNLIVMLGILWFLLSFFTPDLLLSETITTGGDTASHYYTAQYLKDYLLPRGKISGWCPGNYAGFPMLQFYFPLPFLLMVFLSYIIPLQVAFKLISVLGIFLLPITTFFCMRLMRFRFPMPIIAAIFTLPFLFMEANSMWGGNIPSTLAGEFSYGISLSLTILFFGLMYRGTTSGRFWIWNSLLLAIIALTHVYTLLFAVVSSVFLLFTKDRKELESRLIYMTKTYILSFLLVAFWILPLILNLHYTTSYDIIWIIHHIGEVFPLILVPFIILAIAGMYLSISDRDLKIAYFYFPVLVASMFYLSASHIGVVDIRFIPFIQLFIMLQAAYCFSRITSELKGKWLLPLIVLFLVVIWINNAKMIEEHSKPCADQVISGNFSSFIPLTEKWFKDTLPEIMENKYHGFTPHWIKWNYEGFEGKGTWKQFQELNEFLNGSFQDPRVVYEHSPIHNRFGSSRAFESLPLFAGRATLEGLYMQSTISSSFIFYIQSEVSEKQSCPFWANYPCTRFDLKKGTKHLEMFNVKHFIAITDKAKNALSNDSEYTLVKRVKDYEIYELTTNSNQYVFVPKYEPVLFKTNNREKASYFWFRNTVDVKSENIHIQDAVEKKDINICFNIVKDPNEEKECIILVAAAVEDMNICFNLLSEGTERDHCIEGVAVSTKDINYCHNLLKHDLVKKEKCIQSVNSAIEMENASKIEKTVDGEDEFPLLDTPLVFVKEVRDEDTSRFKAIREGNVPRDIPQIPLDNDCHVESTLYNEEILIKTDCVNKPHIIRVSYFPNWRVEGADKIYLVSPSFMLIYPNQKNVRLYYSDTLIDKFGSLLTLAGLILLLFLIYENLSRNQSLSRLLKR